MDTVPLVWLIASALWVLGCVSIVVAVLMRRRRNSFFQDHAFLVGGMVFLATAPSVTLLAYAFTGSLMAWIGGVHVLVALIFLAASFRARRHRLNPAVAGSRMTFREKSATLLLVVLCVVFIGYFYRAWNASLEAVVPLFIGSVALLVVILIIGHIAVALLHVPLGEVEDAPDERDRAVELRSIRNAHYVLVGGIWITMGAAIADVSTLTIANTAFAAFVLSEIVRYGSLVTYYRLGAP